MLRGIQKATSNWLGRVITGVILGLIAVSFAVWGIGDIFRGFGQSTVAKIGSTEIGVEQFRQLYNERLQQLARRLGRPIPPDQARALGLPQQMLGQMLAETALDENARRLGLRLADADVAERITSDPNFRGLNGQFDKTRFDAVIRQAGFTEARFVAEQRKVMLRRQIAEALAGGLNPPRTALEAQNRYINEERSIAFITLDRAQAGEIPAPAPDVIAKYFEERKTLFRAPEYRKIDIFVLSPQDNARWAEVSDADARKAYETNRARYVTPERRELQQIVFPNADEARAASQKIAGGATFEQIAQERGLKLSDTNLGMVAKASMLDQAVAEAAFKLAAGQVSEPVAGRFGTAIVRVNKIEPEKVRPFEEVSAEIKRELAQERAKAQVVEQQNKIEDERGAGHPLAEILEKLDLKPTRIEAVDRSGRGPDGQPVKGLPAGVDLVGLAFASDVGIENDVVRLPDGGYAWYDVISTTPSRERPLSEVQDRVIERWRDDEIAKVLKEKAEQLAATLKTSTIEEVAKTAGVTAQAASGLKRTAQTDAVPAGVVDDVFQTPKDGVGNAEGSRPTLRVVFRVTDIKEPKLDLNSPEIKRLEETTRNALFEEVVGQYAAHLQTELGTSINQAALNQVLTGSTN